MGLLDWKRKKKNKDELSVEEKIDSIKASLDSNFDNLDQKYQESMAFFAEQEAKDEQQLNTLIRENNSILSRLDQLEQAPGNQSARQMAKRSAMRIFDDVQSHDLVGTSSEPREKTWEETYKSIAVFFKSLENGNSSNSKWEDLPLDIKPFTFYAYLIEKQTNNMLSDTENKILYGIISNLSNYPDIARKFTLSLGVLVYLGLISIQDVTDYQNPTLFPAVVKTIVSSDAEYLNEPITQRNNKLAESLAAIVQGIEQQSSRIGFADAYFSGKLSCDTANNLDSIYNGRR